MRKLLVLLALLAVGLIGAADAQLIVHDPGNASLNSITSIQTTISAIENVAQTLNQILELTPVDEIILSEQFAETMALISAIVSEAEGLSYDVAQIQQQVDDLFGRDNIPTTPLDLTVRLGEVQQHVYLMRRYALKVQTLLNTLSGAIDHVVRLVSMVSILFGNMSANQVLIQLTAMTNQQLATHTALTASWQRADMVERLSTQLIVLSLNNIEASRWANWPTL